MLPTGKQLVVKIKIKQKIIQIKREKRDTKEIRFKWFDPKPTTLWKTLAMSTLVYSLV